MCIVYRLVSPLVLRLFFMKSLQSTVTLADRKGLPSVRTQPSFPCTPQVAAALEFRLRHEGLFGNEVRP